MGDFVSDYVEFTKHFESPESFWKWSAYAIIAATLRDNIFFPVGLKNIYPNIYMMYVATSGESRKDAPYGFANKILMNPACRSTKIFRGRMSVQGIIDSLSRVYQKASVTIRDGSCLIMASELSAAFVDDKALIPMLTDMSEYYERWEYELRGTGCVGVDKMCVTLWSASNETLMASVFTGDAIFGGLLARTFVVTPNETRPANSLMDVNPDDYKLDAWVERVKDIRDNIKGVFTATPDARELYNVWYKKLYASYKSTADNTGVLQRMHTNVLKLAMIKTAAIVSKEITDAIMQDSIEEVEDLLMNYKKFTTMAGKAANTNMGVVLITYLFNSANYTCTRRSFLRDNWQDISAEDLDKLTDTLEAAGHITKLVAGGNKSGYTLTKETIEKFRKKDKK